MHRPSRFPLHLLYRAGAFWALLAVLFTATSSPGMGRILPALTSSDGRAVFICHVQGKLVPGHHPEQTRDPAQCCLSCPMVSLSASGPADRFILARLTPSLHLRADRARISPPPLTAHPAAHQARAPPATA